MARFPANGSPYRVLASPKVVDQFRRYYRTARKQGREDSFIEACRKISARLTRNPFDFGEPLYRLPALRMQIRHGVVDPLLIYFGVLEDRPLVFIKGVVLLPQRGL